ncbi:MAG: hypothetical protein PVI11_04620 [Candidatus Aminicenantes bacterium]|jgi:predicted membrane-bound spermidine synthase
MNKQIKIRFGFLVTLLVFFSGFCSLTYQVIWERTLKYSFGGDVISASIIVSVFLLGLGIGGFLFRKVRQKALITLAFVELCIGLFGMWSYEILLFINKTLTSFNLELGMGDLGETISVFIGTFLFLLLPTILMGGTLPLMVESFIPKVDKNTKFIGFIYGINVLGAVVGTLLPLLFFGNFGLPNTLKLTSLLSVLIAVSLFAMVGKSPTQKEAFPPPARLAEGRLRRENTFFIAIAFMTGFIALALEILFIRFIGIMHGSSSYSFPTIMSTYLFSMSFGSIFWSYVRDRVKISRGIPYILLMAVGILIPLTAVIFQVVINTDLSKSFNFTSMFTTFSESLAEGNYFIALRHLFNFSLPFLLLIVPVVFFSSGIFPTLIKNLSENKISLGKSTGIIYFSNSVGCTCGSLFTGFLAIPLLGWYSSLVLLSFLSILIGILGFLVFFFPRTEDRLKHTAGGPKRRYAVILFLSLPIILFSLSDKKIKYNLATGTYDPGISIVAYEEGITGVAAVTEEVRKNDTIYHVYSNGQYMSALPNHPRHAYLAHLPRLQMRLKSVLLLGLGGGRSLADLLKDSRIEHIVAVDWSRETVTIVGSDAIIPFNQNPLSDPRVRIEMSDARKVVSAFAQRSIQFDAIIDNLCFPHWPGAGGVKSIQFFKNIRKILDDKGYYYHINNFDGERNLILSTLCEAFERVVIHNGMMVICGAEEYRPSENQIKKILGEKGLLARAPDMFVPQGLELDAYHSHFLQSITPVRKEDFGQLKPLTDEIPSTEYYITIPLLIDTIKAGFKKGSQP